MRPSRFVLTLIAAAFALLLAAGPAIAQDRSTSADSFVVLTGRLDVAEGEVVDDAVIFDGDATIAGTVRQNVVAFNGDITISGTVEENVIAINGRVTLADGARIGGDVASQQEPDIAAGATIGGTVSRNGLPTDLRFKNVVAVGRVAIWIATSVSSLILGLLLLLFAPRAGEAIAATARERFGLSVGIGFAVFFGLPVAAIIAIATLVGIPFGGGVLLALGLLFWLGYVASAHALGRRIVKPPTSPLLAFLAGWGILRVVAIIPGIGGLMWFLATVFGLGALTVAARRGGRRGQAVAALTGTPAAPPPMPPAP